MGKLHTLRRAIERNPDQWYRVYHGDRVDVYGVVKFIGKKGYFKPDWPYGKSYKQFVTSVLVDLKLIRVGKRNGRSVLVTRNEHVEIDY